MEDNDKEKSLADFREHLKTLNTRSKQNQALYHYCKKNYLKYHETEESLADILIPYTETEKARRYIRAYLKNRDLPTLMTAFDYNREHPDLDISTFIRGLSMNTPLDYSAEALGNTAKELRKMADLMESLETSIGQDTEYDRDNLWEYRLME